jgi:4-amino-4-deoxy-L-arabinose transferase-like glycosyltransferase
MVLSPRVTKNPPETPKVTAPDSPKSLQGGEIVVPGTGRSRVTLILEPGANVIVDIVKRDEDGGSQDAGSIHLRNRRSKFLTSLKHFKPAGLNWGTLAILLSILIYLVSRFIALDSFPIYFFSDEAIQTVRAGDLLLNDFYGEKEELLPTYLINGGQYNLGVSVYIQMLPTLIFGRSIWVTRGLCVLFSLFAVLGVGLSAKNVFKSGQPYLYILILSTLPTWFLHSRTAFETALATSFYAAFLYCYMMYRQGRFGWLYAAAAFGALTFYSYSPAQMVMAVTALALFLSDLRYHWRQRKHVFITIGLLLVFTIPYVRYLVNHPGENMRHLLILDSYLVKSTTVWQKIATYFKYYLLNINPVYWFFPNDVDLIRHVMKGYGHLGWWFMPFIAVGLVNGFRKIKESTYRVVLIALLAAPAGAALTGQGVTRALFMVIPAALLAGLGLDQVIAWLRRIRINPRAAAVFCLAALIGLNTYMVYDVVKNAPTWFTDYGLSGMQYGARQVFSAALDYMEEHPEDKLIISSQWANGTDTLAHYFLSKPLPYDVGSIEQWLTEQKPLDASFTFVVIPEEMKLIQDSGKFKAIDVVQTIDYPNGQIGFYFVKAAYVDNIAAIFAKEVEDRHVLITEAGYLGDGTEVIVSHNAFDMGKLADAFDGNPASVIRSEEANPMHFNMQFPTPRSYQSLTLRIGGNPTRLEVQFIPADGRPVINFSQDYPVSGDYRDITFTLDKAIPLSEVRISVTNTESGEPDHVHLWEITLK